MIRATPALAGTRIVSPAPRQVWRDVIVSDPDTVVTQSPEWLDCLCATRGFVDASRLYVLPDGRRVVLPLVAREVAGVRLSEESMPYGWGYGGVIAEGGELTAADRCLVLSDLAGRRVVRSVLVNPLAGAGWAEVAPAGTVQAPYTSAVIDLEGGFDLVWSKRISGGRRATRCGRPSVSRWTSGASTGVAASTCSPSSTGGRSSDGQSSVASHYPWLASSRHAGTGPARSPPCRGPWGSHA